MSYCSPNNKVYGPSILLKVIFRPSGLKYLPDEIDRISTADRMVEPMFLGHSRLKAHYMNYGQNSFYKA